MLKVQIVKIAGQGVSLSVTRQDETAGKGDCAGNAANSRRQQTGYGCGRSAVDKP